ERFGVRPRDVPEGDDRRARQALADHARQQREVVILHEDDRVLGARLVDHHVGEALVDVLVVLPVRRAKGRSGVGDVAERPETFVGKAEVVALLLLFRQPYPADAVRGTLGRHHDVVVLVHRVAVGGARAVRDPGSGAGAHDRLERGDEAARRALDLDHVVLAPHVQVGLAIGDDHDLVALQVLAQDAAQRLRAPDGLAFIARVALGSRSRTSACRSRAIGRSSGDVALSPSGERSRVSPESSAFTPATQPRQLISAISIVISATTRAMPAKRISTYFLVSALRRSTKLMSCTISRSPIAVPSAAIGLVQMCNGPSESCSTKLRACGRSLAPGQRTACGKWLVA